MGVSKNSGFYPKSSILIGLSIINKPSILGYPIFGNIHICIYIYHISANTHLQNDLESMKAEATLTVIRAT